MFAWVTWCSWLSRLSNTQTVSSSSLDVTKFSSFLSQFYCLFVVFVLLAKDGGWAGEGVLCGFQFLNQEGGSRALKRYWMDRVFEGTGLLISSFSNAFSSKNSKVEPTWWGSKFKERKPESFPGVIVSSPWPEKRDKYCCFV
ncbi:hypothetical protein DFJ73DRAFT_965541 [Zopfochytrium polystomum]|nr:hypothetical protein DFJ73DRAFT_965541 [Zopfochytrium polystomum]